MSVRTPDVLDASATVRAAGADDVVPIHALAVDNAMFAPDDMAGLAECFRATWTAPSTSIAGSSPTTRYRTVLRDLKNLFDPTAGIVL